MDYALGNADDDGMNFFIYSDKSVQRMLPVSQSNTVETRIKEPIFIRTLRLKFNISNLLNKNLS